MSAVVRNDELLRLLDVAVAAHQSGDPDQLNGALEALSEWRSRPLHTVLSRVAHELSDDRVRQVMSDELRPTVVVMRSAMRAGGMSRPRRTHS